MKFVLALSISVGSIFMAESASAGDYADLDNVQITKVFVHYQNGNAYIETSEAVGSTDHATCTDDTNRIFLFNVNSEPGRALFSLAMAAYLSGKEVRVRGIGTCTMAAGMEDLAYIVSH